MIKCIGELDYNRSRRHFLYLDASLSRFAECDPRYCSRIVRVINTENVPCTGTTGAGRAKCRWRSYEILRREFRFTR